MPPSTGLAAPAGLDRYLAGQVGRVRLLHRQLLSGMIALGRVLLETREAVGRHRFRAWLPAAGVSRPTAYRVMRVAEVFGPLFPGPGQSQAETGRLCPTAAYALSERGAPAGAAAYAAEQVRDGRVVTHAAAVEILDAYRPVRVAPAAVAALAPADPKPPAAPPPGAGPWAVLVGLLEGGASLHFVVTADPGQDCPHYGATYYPADGGRPRHAVRRRPEDLVRHLAGVELVHPCRACRGAFPASEFAADAGRPGGVSACCRSCEKPRVNAAKRAARARRRAGPGG